MLTIITIIKAMRQVVGSEIILIGSIICTIFLIALFLLFKANRNSKALTRYIIYLIIVFEICDVIWLRYFFPSGRYVDRGLAPVGPLLLYPVFGIALNIYFTVINRQKDKEI